MGKVKVQVAVGGETVREGGQSVLAPLTKNCTVPVASALSRVAVQVTAPSVTEGFTPLASVTTTFALLKVWETLFED